MATPNSEDSKQGSEKNSSGIKIESEGLAKFYVEKSVFFNPAMSTNRDLSLSVVETYGKLLYEKAKTVKKVKFNGLKIFEGLAATGIRSCRYVQELTPEVLNYVHANDLDPNACKFIEESRKLNGIPSEKLVITNGDVNQVLACHSDLSSSFHIVDIDPYGSAAPFVDNAIRAVTPGGLLCVTCTDLTILCGNNPEACYRKYGSFPIHFPHISHEMALRIVLNMLSVSAGKYGRGIEPVLSLYIDYYIRIYVKITTRKAIANEVIKKTGDFFFCYKCGNYKTQPNGTSEMIDDKLKYHSSYHRIYDCELCNSHFRKAGPVWLGNLHDKSFVQSVIKTIDNLDFLPTKERLISRLKIIGDELDEPFFIIPKWFGIKLKLEQIPLKLIRSALVNGLYKQSGSHIDPNVIKTNADMSVLIDIVKEYYKKYNRNPELNELGKKVFENHKTKLENVSLSLHKDVIMQMDRKLFKVAPVTWGPGKAAKGTGANYNFDEVNDNKHVQKLNLDGYENVEFGEDVGMEEDDSCMVMHQGYHRGRGYHRYRRGRGRNRGWRGARYHSPGGYYSHRPRGRGRGRIRANSALSYNIKNDVNAQN